MLNALTKPKVFNGLYRVGRVSLLSRKQKLVLSLEDEVSSSLGVVKKKKGQETLYS